MTWNNNLNTKVKELFSRWKCYFYQSELSYLSKTDPNVYNWFLIFFFNEKDIVILKLIVFIQKNTKRERREMARKCLKKMVIKAFHYLLKDEGNHEVSIPISLKYANQIIIIICLWKQRLADPKIIL